MFCDSKSQIEIDKNGKCDYNKYISDHSLMTLTQLKVIFHLIHIVMKWVKSLLIRDVSFFPMSFQQICLVDNEYN